jgi:aminoglycoside phosphotransferase (APT) family kinase protein
MPLPGRGSPSPGGPPAERLHRALRESRPAPCPNVTLVHGDAKPGNFAFSGGEVSAVFDWEMTTVGDPLTDIGRLEMLWMQPVGINSHPAALPIDALLAHYEAISGIGIQNRSWYRAFNAYKMAVICLIGAMLVEDGHSDDQKLVLAAYGTAMMTKAGLSELGIDEPLDDGPVLPRDERIQQILAHAT